MSTLSDFQIVNRLGSGSFGVVYKVKRLADEQFYVIKSVRIAELSHREQLDAINEVTILAKMNSPYVVRYFDSFVDQESLHIVMEYCNRGDLQTLLKKAKEKNMSGLKENVTWNIFLQIVLGLFYLHQQKILHRDLKTANVFLMKDDSQPFFLVKIGDLGVAKLLETSTAFAKTIVGTPYYLSPELCADQPYRDKSDCWALGVLLYECCTLKHPFEARNQCALIMKIIQAHFALPTGSSAEMINLVVWLLQKDPSNRPSIKDILNEDYIRSKLEENNFDVPQSLLDNQLGFVLQPPTTTEQLASNGHEASSLGPTKVIGLGSSVESLLPSPVGPSPTNAVGSTTQVTFQQSSINGATINMQQHQQATISRQQIVLNPIQQQAGHQPSQPAPSTTRRISAPQAGRATVARGQQAGAKDAAGASSVKGNRVRGGKPKIQSEKALKVHQVRRSSNPERVDAGAGQVSGVVGAAIGGGRRGSGIDRALSDQARDRESRKRGASEDTTDDEYQRVGQEEYDIAQEKEAVRQLEQVLMKEAQSKTSYLVHDSDYEEHHDSEDKDGDEKASGARLSSLLENATYVRRYSDSLADSKKLGGGVFFATEVDLAEEDKRNLSLKQPPAESKAAFSPRSTITLVSQSSTPAPTPSSRSAMGAKDTTEDEDDVEEHDYDDDFEADEDDGNGEIYPDDDDDAEIVGEVGDGHVEKSFTEDDVMPFISKEDLKRNIEDLVDLVDDARHRAKTAMGADLFEQVYDACLSHMDRKSNEFHQDAMDPASPFIMRLESILFEKMPERNIEEVLSVVFSVKVLCAMENRLNMLLDLESSME